MTEDNLALVVSADPQLSKAIEATKDVTWHVPKSYEREIGDILVAPVSLIPGIDTPEDYKTLVVALNELKQCKQRAATIRHHLGILHFRWTSMYKKANKLIETKYYKELSGVRAETKKAILTNALEPISSGVDEIEYLVGATDRCQKHLTDLNWAVTESGKLVVQYFNAIKVFVPREI